jgi:hypothetical protein
MRHVSAAVVEPNPGKAQDICAGLTREGITAVAYDSIEKFLTSTSRTDALVLSEVFCASSMDTIGALRAAVPHMRLVVYGEELDRTRPPSETSARDSGPDRVRLQQLRDAVRGHGR